MKEGEGRCLVGIVLGRWLVLGNPQPPLYLLVAPRSNVLFTHELDMYLVNIHLPGYENGNGDAPDSDQSKLFIRGPSLLSVLDTMS